MNRDPHQHPERVAGHVIGRLGRPARKEAEIRIHLLLEHRLGEGAVGLRRLDDVGPGRILRAIGRERRGGAIDLDVREFEDLQHLVGRVRIALRRRDDEGVRALAVVHPVTVHAVEVVEPLAPVLRHVRHAGQRRCDAVVHLLPERPRVLRVRHWKVPVRLLRPQRLPLLRVDERVGEVAAARGDLGEDARLTVIDHVLPRRRPHVVALEPRDALLPFPDQRGGHRLAYRRLPERQQRVDVDVERIGERRHEDARARRALLVHVVRDDRLVLVLHQLDVHARFLLREHEPVTIVVVADVLVVEVGVDAGVVGPLGLVPVIDDQVLAVRVLRRHHQDHGVVENLAHERRALRGQPVDDGEDGLPVGDFRRVDGRVDQVERLAFRRQLLRLPVRQPARIREAPVDLDQPIELREVLRGADAQQRVVVPHRGLADDLELHPIGLPGEQGEVLEDLRVAGELAVGADLEAEELLRRRNRLRQDRRGQGQGKAGDEQRADEARAHRTPSRSEEIVVPFALRLLRRAPTCGGRGCSAGRESRGPRRRPGWSSRSRRRVRRARTARPRGECASGPAGPRSRRRNPPRASRG